MNNSGSSSSGSGSSYVSCIEVDGRPILPPIMTESLRMEMRRYRELAIRVETTLQFNKRSKKPIESKPVSESSAETVTKQNTTVVASSKIPVPTPVSKTKLPSKSTESQPVFKQKEEEEDKQVEELMKDSPILSSDTSLKLNVTQNTQSSKYEDHFVIKKPFGGAPDKVPAFPSDEDSCSSSNNDSEDSSDKPRFIVQVQSGKNNSFNKDNVESEDDLMDFRDVDQEAENDDDEPTVSTSIDSHILSSKVSENQRNSHLPLKEDDDKSESMSLVSLDVEEKAQRREVENYKSDDSDIENSLENHLPISGRSSTETFIIERHNISDSDNNNDFSTTTKTRKYFFSPLPGGRESSENNSIIFNDSTTTTTTKHMNPSRPPRPSILGVTRYFESPEKGASPSDVTLTEVSFTTASTASSSPSVSLSKGNADTRPNTIIRKSDDSPTMYSNSPMQSARDSVTSGNRIYFTSPNTDAKSSTNPSETSVPPNTPSSQYQYSFMEGSPRKTTRETGTQMASSSSINLLSPSQFSSTYHKSETSPVASTQTHQPPKTPNSGFSFSDFQNRLNRATATTNTMDAVQSTHPPSNNAMGRVNLVTLQSAMQNMSPSFFKIPPDSRSALLLKGVVLSDPLFRPKKELRIPPEASDPAMQPKFARISAAAKGYLIRRILRTDKIQMIIQTIRDTVELVLKLYEEVPQLRTRGGKGIKPEDADLCRRLFQQLTGACASFHDVFFKLTTAQRMAIIANDREKLKAKELKTYYSQSRSSSSVASAKQKRFNHSKRKISTATAKSLARRVTIHN